GMAGDLLQRRDHGVGVLGELDRAGIGEIFALARYGEAERDGEEARDDEDGDRDQDEDDRAAAALAAAFPAAAARAAAAPAPAPPRAAAAAAPAAAATREQDPRTADDEVADQRDDADENGSDDQELDVAVLDMRQLVGEHRFELGVVERVDEATRDSNGI